MTEIIKGAPWCPPRAILPGEEGGTSVLVWTPRTSRTHGRESRRARGRQGADPERRPARREVVIVGGIGLDDKAKVRIDGSPETKSRRREGRGRDNEAPESSAALDGPPRQAHHLRHPHAGRRRRLSGAHDSGRGLSRDRFSAHRGRRRQRRVPHRPDAGHGHPAVEEAVNSVHGLEHVRSITSRGTAEIDLFFSWKVDMFRTLELVNAALARVAASTAADRQDHRQPPDVRRRFRSWATA